MRKLILYSAASLDGYIAGTNHEIDWLFADSDYGYASFYDSIDTTVSGYNTYKLSLTFDSFPYPDKNNFVFSRHHSHSENSPVNFITGDPVEFVKKLKAKSGKDIWLVGGGQINTLMLNARLIDELIISIHPVILGKGIPLFAGLPGKCDFFLAGTKSYPDGLLQVTYSYQKLEINSLPVF
jgi:dihydrofolate reductase